MFTTMARPSGSVRPFHDGMCQVRWTCSCFPDDSSAPFANPQRTLRLKSLPQSTQRKPAKSAEEEAPEILKLHICQILEPDSRRTRVRSVTNVRRSPSSGGAFPLMVHPLTDEARAGDDAEVAIFAVDQAEEGSAVQLLQVREIQLGPQAALGRRLNQL